MAHPIEVTSDGWIVTDLRVFRTLTDAAPPRRWGYWDQIRVDVHEPKIVGMWVVGVGLTAAAVGLTAAAVVTGQWLLLMGGLLLLGGLPPLFLWAYLARNTVRSIRAHPVGTGVIDGLDPDPIIPTIIAGGRAMRSTGEPVDVVVGVPLAREIERAGTPAEVRFIDDPNWPCRGVFAARPVRLHLGGPP